MYARVMNKSIFKSFLWMISMVAEEHFRVDERWPGLLFVPVSVSLAPFVNAATKVLPSREECAKLGCEWRGGVLREGWETWNGVHVRTGCRDGLDVYLRNMLMHGATYASMNGWHGGPLLKYASAQVNTCVDSFDTRAPHNNARVVQMPAHKARGLMACMASSDWGGWQVLNPCTHVWEPLTADKNEMVVALGALGQWAHGIAAPMLRVMYEPDCDRRRTVTLHWDKPLSTPDCDFVLDRTETAPEWATSVNNYMQMCRKQRVFYNPDHGTEPLISGHTQ